MLTEVCDFVHNYFEFSYNQGDFEIADGAITLDFLLDGQRFRIVGSALNDGIYTYHSDGVVFNDDNTETAVLNDETFSGTIIGMSVPRTFLKLVQEIADWVETNKSVLDSPYTSESFGGYSYTKASGNGSARSGTGSVLTWQDMFRKRLNAYRKIA